MANPIDAVVVWGAPWEPSWVSSTLVYLPRGLWCEFCGVYAVNIAPIPCDYPGTVACNTIGDSWCAICRANFFHTHAP